MRPPSLRLTDRGTGSQTITVYPVTWTADEDANPIKTPATVGTAYPAIVTKTDALLADDGSGIVQSTTAYKVMVLTASMPPVTTETICTWTIPIANGSGGPPVTHDLVAAGQPTFKVVGAWEFDANEVTPDGDGADGPYQPGGA